MKHSAKTKRSNSIKTGDVVCLGEHRLLCGSSLDAEKIARFFAGASIAAIISDPPYGVSYTQNKEGIADVKVKKNILNDDIASEEEYETFSVGWLSLALPFLAVKNSIYIFNSDRMLFALKRALDVCGVHFSQLLIWVKNQGVLGRKDYLPQHELILFGWYGTHAFYRSKDKSVLCYPRPHASALHPTMKSVPLIRNLILNSTKLGDVVYDPFGGSGTTLIACEHTKRRCYMVEADLEYCETIIARWEKLTGLTAEHI